MHPPRRREKLLVILPQQCGIWRGVLWGASMSHAIKLIVDGYVRLNDRQALEDVLGHRRHLGKQLKESPPGVDLSGPIHLIDAEIAVIEAGLERLNTATA
jgi:hypothetical protein